MEKGGHPHVAARLLVIFLLLAGILALPAVSWARSSPMFPGRSPHLMQEVLNDLGFKPDVNGFSFENYGDEGDVQNLTEEDVRELFGDEACTMESAGALVLTPPAQQWMEEVNSQMANGHCEGMASLSLMFYAGDVSISDYGAENAYDLTFEDPDLQSEIAHMFATQVLEPTASSVIKGTPTEILELLQNNMSKDGETYTLGIYKSNGSGGHAITPYAVQDDGGGRYRIMVYDNNYPGEERAVSVDANTDTWSYEASINPEEESELYEGNAQTMTLEATPTSERLSRQAAPFALNPEGPALASKGLAVPAEDRYNQLFLDGQAHVLIMDEQGRMLGYSDGQFVSQIPGAKYTRIKAGSSAGHSPEPVYWLPEKMSIGATIDGTGLTAESPADLIIIGPGFATGVEGIKLEPGQKDMVIFDPTDQAVSYETDRTSSPNFVIAVEDKGDVAYYFEIQGAKMEGGGTITAVLDTKSKDLLLNTEKLKNEGVFDLLMTRLTRTEEDSIEADDIKLPAGAMIYMNYGEWKGPGSPVQFGVDTNGDGEIDDVYEAESRTLEKPATSKSDGGGMPFWIWIIVGVVVALAVVVAIILGVRRRRSPA